MILPRIYERSPPKTPFSGEKWASGNCWKLFKVWPLLLRELAKCKAPTAFKIVPSAGGLENLGLTKGIKK
jgi:hypothetical protein